MRRISILLIALMLLSFAYPVPVFPAPPAVEYLCEFGISFYLMGRYNDALIEFKKALLIDPNNQTAKQYIERIFKIEMSDYEVKEKIPPKQIIKKIEKKSPPKLLVKESKRPLTKDEAMTETFKKLSYREPVVSPSFVAGKSKLQEKTEGKEQVGNNIEMSGQVQLSFGILPDHFLWKRANYDLNERNARMLSDANFNRRFNTYDPRVFDSLDLDLDTKNEGGFNFHGNIVVDPWSFTGKSARVTVTSAFLDTADVELKYWSNTGYTIGEIISTNLTGNSFALPEVKVSEGKVGAFNVNGAFLPIVDTFSISEMKIYRQFQPIRELWLDYNQGPLKFRIFPMAYQDQALVCDDPLGISNHHTWWEDSLWLRRYKPGNYNSGAGALDFTKGYWDNSLAFLSRNSNGVYLTALRGLSFNYQAEEGTSLSTTIATPKHLWQDYAEMDNLISASRLKYYLADNLLLGSTFTTRTGFAVEQGDKADSENYVGGMDLGYEFLDGAKAQVEILTSKSYYDLTNSEYKTKSRGNAYYFSLVARYPFQSIMDLQYGYDEIKLEKNEPFLLKSKFFLAHMDDGFDSALSSFRNTRNDTFWSRHISFRRPFEYYSAGLASPALNWDEVNATRIGDGMDIGRDAWGFRIETAYEDKFNNLFDLRNVHRTDGKYVETVTRDEVTAKLNDKATLKLLGIYQDLPKTKGGIDPFIFDSQTGEFLVDQSSNPIDDGKDPSLRTGSIGLDYAFFDWLSANAIWEHTNDYTLAYGNFPRGVFNSGEPSRIYYENGRKYRADQLYLYDQQLFPQPPYHFYDIYKLGLRFAPIDKLDIYLDYVRNEFEMAGQNSDNMNHLGMEITYMPTAKIGFALKYTYSRWKDLDRLRAGITKPIGHHNFFSEFRYLASSDDEFICQYGEGNTAPLGNITYDPYGGSLLTIDTQHIIRAYYRRKF